jgi:hypothetical protein
MTKIWFQGIIGVKLDEVRTRFVILSIQESYKSYKLCKINWRIKTAKPQVIEGALI